MNKFLKGLIFFALALLTVYAILAVAEEAQVGDGWTGGNINLKHCQQFAAVAGGVASLDPWQRGQAYVQADTLNEYRAGMLRDALTFVAGEKLTNPYAAQALALTRCSGHRKSGPSLWEWNIGVGYIGPY